MNQWKQAATGETDFNYYTIVIYEQMERYELNFAQYSVIQYIINTSKKTGGAPGWSKASSQTISEALGFTSRYINSVKKTLVERNILETRQGVYRLATHIDWVSAKSVSFEDKRRSKFDNTARKRLDLTFKEYALLKYLQHLLMYTDYSITRTGHKVVTVSKKMMGEKIDTHRVSVQHIIERLEERGFLKRIAANIEGKNIYGVYLLVDMDREDKYELDTNGYVYQPSRTVSVTE